MTYTRTSGVTKGKTVYQPSTYHKVCCEGQIFLLVGNVFETSIIIIYYFYLLLKSIMETVLKNMICNDLLVYWM